MYAAGTACIFRSMTARVLEAVPNFSEGRDRGVVETIVEAVRRAGADVLDWSADADHNRSVVTFVGPPEVVEDASVAAAGVAMERIDLREHAGVHPRIGALDVLPFVPLAGLDLQDARAAARRVGRRLAEEVGVPVFFYGAASEPPGRTLADLRRGGFERLVEAWPTERLPDLLPPHWSWAGAHPTAGATCIGARPVLLAWNVVVAGITLGQASSIAERLRENTSGHRGVRALAFTLEERGALQISMNLEDLAATSPMDVFGRLEMLLGELGGRLIETEIIGLIPDELLLTAAADRLRLVDARVERMLTPRVLKHIVERNASRHERPE